jgi:hypothetical protein
MRTSRRPGADNMTYEIGYRRTTPFLRRPRVAGRDGAPTR